MGPGGLQVRLEREQVHVVGGQLRQCVFEHADLLGHGRLVRAAGGLVHAEQGDLRVQGHTLVRPECRGLDDAGHVVDGRVEVVLTAAQLGQVGPQPCMGEVEILAGPGAGRVHGPGSFDPGERSLDLSGFGEVPQAERAVLDDDVGLPGLVLRSVVAHGLPEFLLAHGVEERSFEPQDGQHAQHMSCAQAGHDGAPGQRRPVLVQPVVRLLCRLAPQPVQYQLGHACQLPAVHDVLDPLLDLPAQRLKVVRSRHLISPVRRAAARFASDTAPAPR